MTTCKNCKYRWDIDMCPVVKLLELDNGELIHDFAESEDNDFFCKKGQDNEDN